MTSTRSHRGRDLRGAIYQQHVADLCRCVNPRPVAGSQDVLSELVQTTDGRWITKPPSHCSNGHLLGPSQVLVGHVACLGHGGGGHTSWHWRTCDAVVYGPRSTSTARPLKACGGADFKPHSLTTSAGIGPSSAWVAGRPLSVLSGLVAARIGNLLPTGGRRSDSPPGPGALGGVRLPATRPSGVSPGPTTVTDSHTPGLPVTPARHDGGSRAALVQLPISGHRQPFWDTPPQNRLVGPGTSAAVEVDVFKGHG